MKNNIRGTVVGVMAAGIMAMTSLGGLFTMPVSADETVTVNGFTLARESATDGWTVVSFDGSTADAVIPDVVDADGNTTENPENPVAGSVMYIKESVFEDLGSIETLKLPKWLSGHGKGDKFDNKIFNELSSLKAFESNNLGNGFYTDNGVLYAGNELVSYPQKKTGDYSIKDGTVSADGKAFVNANIGTLTIPNGFLIDNQKGTNLKGEDYFKYTFLSASVDYFEGYNCVNGSVIQNGRLIAFGNNATTDLSGITSANPYAFQNEEILNKSNLPESVKKTVPFSFYGGEEEGLQTRYFNIDGKTAYCYDHGKLNPETVGDLSDYDEAVSDEVTRHNVKAILFAGYPNDAYGLLESTGVSEEAAKNITGSMVWEAVDKVSFDLEDIYGAEDREAARNYMNSLREKVNKTSDSVMEDFELKFYKPVGDVQGLVVINKISRPEIPNKPSITISKQDITTKEELPGASLKVEKDGMVIDEWVSTSEKHVISNLEDGTYILTEITAPDGYEIAESITFTVVDGVVSSEEIVMFDKPIEKPADKFVFISKQDITTKKELPGAKLELTKDGVVIDSWTSTSEVHKIKNLADGIYVLTEITAPNGYEVAEDVTFEVKDGVVETGTVIMFDKPIEKPADKFVFISKQDITTKKELPGAKLELTKDGVVIDSWTSTNEIHKIKNLADGEYVLTEITAPNGYEVAEDVTFIVVNGIVESGTVVMFDKPVDEYVYISKQDITTKKELPGAKLELTKDGVVVDSWTSTNEVHKIKNLADGTYVLTEKSAPDGYEIAESITFEVKDGKTAVNPIVMYDEVKVPTPSKPSKPSKPTVDGNYSGPDPKPTEPNNEKPNITIITPTEESKEEKPAPIETEPNKPSDKPIRKPIKTGDVMGTLELMLGTILLCGAGMYLNGKRKKQ